jgi:hypothetical protein
MPYTPEDSQNEKKMLAALIALNRALVKQQYRLLLLKTHTQKTTNIIDQNDLNFYYLN